MKKARAVNGTIDGYLANLPKVDRDLLESLRKIIKTIVPDVSEEISYGIPTFRYKGEYLVGFGAAKKFCSFYAMSGSLIGNHKDELQAYDCTKSAIHFTSNKPLPATLVKKLVKWRIEENEKREAKAK